MLSFPKGGERASRLEAERHLLKSGDCTNNHGENAFYRS
jgi:hypothetical protein